MRSQNESITELLNGAQRGDAEAREKLAVAAYPRLRAMAGHCFADERAGHTLQATALVNEAYLRGVLRSSVAWRNSEHFYSVCARQMRLALIDHGRARGAVKRGCGLRVECAFNENRQWMPDNRREIELLKELLERLQKADPLAASVVEVKFFAGLTDEEVAQKLGCSHSAVRRHWKFARTWLARQASE
jgi:RNA polymerase sigma factor (TIGR02999 family)